MPGRAGGGGAGGGWRWGDGGVDEELRLHLVAAAAAQEVTWFHRLCDVKPYFIAHCKLIKFIR